MKYMDPHIQLELIKRDKQTKDLAAAYCESEKMLTDLVNKITETQHNFYKQLWVILWDERRADFINEVLSIQSEDG